MLKESTEPDFQKIYSKLNGVDGRHHFDKWDPTNRVVFEECVLVLTSYFSLIQEQIECYQSESLLEIFKFRMKKLIILNKSLTLYRFMTHANNDNNDHNNNMDKTVSFLPVSTSTNRTSTSTHNNASNCGSISTNNNNSLLATVYYIRRLFNDSFIHLSRDIIYDLGNYYYQY